MLQEMKNAGGGGAVENPMNRAQKPQKNTKFQKIL